MIGICNIERHARNLEHFAPPRDEVELPLRGARAILDMRWNSECNIVAVRFADLHGVVTRSARVRPDDQFPAGGLPYVSKSFDDVRVP